MRTHDTRQIEAFYTSASVARLANTRGDSLTAAGVRLAAATQRIRTAALAGGRTRLFLAEDVEAFLAARAARRKVARAA